MKPITGHVTCKDGKWYAVINFPKVEGKRHEKWTPLDLEGPGKKKAAEARLNELLVRYNSSQSYMDQVLDKNELEQKRQRELRVDEYIGEWLEKHKSKRNIAVTTYSSYHTMLSSHIKPYFQNLCVSLGDVTENDIDDFYTKLFEAGLKGKTVQHYHAFLHLAFKNAVAKRIIASNPCDFVDRPKADEYIGEHLNATEVKKLIEGLKDDPMRVPTIITAYYGLRRSEVLGIKWSAIDFEEKSIEICHKIIEDGSGEHKTIKGLDVMKTKSSHRTLPLIPQVEEVLREEKCKQEEMRKAFRSAYNKKYAEYVCVDALGNLLSPQYITTHFPVILKRLGIRKIRFHDLRHTCATLMINNGVQLKMAQSWLGHSSITTTANIYSHVDHSSKLASANVISELLKN